jgi:succinate dehydrogenase hydrophobic anchor subunit
MTTDYKRSHDEGASDLWTLPLLLHTQHHSKIQIFLFQRLSIVRIFPLAIVHLKKASFATDYKQSHDGGASDLWTLPLLLHTQHHSKIQIFLFQRLSIVRIFPLAIVHLKKASFVGAFTLQILFHRMKWGDPLKRTL